MSSVSQVLKTQVQQEASLHVKENASTSFHKHFFGGSMAGLLQVGVAQKILARGLQLSIGASAEVLLDMRPGPDGGLSRSRSVK